MLARLNHTRLLRFAGLFTWAMVGLPMVYSWWMPLAQPATGVAEDVVALPPTSWAGWLAYLAFGASYAALTRALGSRASTIWDNLLLVILTLSAVSLSYFSESGLGSILQMVAACVLPWMLPVRGGVAWLLASQIIVIPVYIRGLGFPVVEALMQSVLYAGFSGFVFVVSLVARQQAQAREEQRQLNAELRATRLLLAESARINERTRIARELHDLLGHHLTALSLNLEVAGHLTEGRARQHVQQGHTLAKLLLTDVREAVSTLREDGAIDLSAALRPLTENVPALDIHMDIEAPLTMDDPERAHVLLRCTQEIITNAVRHAGANNLWISVRRTEGVIVMNAHDDGRGADSPTAGNGLRGMRERLVQHGGTLEIVTRSGAGFRLCLRLPVSTVYATSEGVPV